MLLKGVKVTMDVWNELLTASLNSEDIDASSNVLRDMDYINVYPQKDMLDRYVEL
jgi:hypothetical protein